MVLTPVQNETLMTKRRLCIGSLTVATPLYYLLKHRNDIFRASKLVREFHLKELVARSVMGFFLGVGVSIYFYGAGPLSKEAAIESELRAEGKAQVDGREVEKTSLEYSVEQKRKFVKKTDFLPGKIRDD
jgi:hypothetical protein